MNNKSCLRSVANLRKRHKKLAKDLAALADEKENVINIALLRDISLDLHRTCGLNLASLHAVVGEDTSQHIASLETTAKNFLDLRSKACVKLENILANSETVKLDPTLFVGKHSTPYFTVLCSDDYSTWQPVRAFNVSANDRQLTIYAKLTNGKPSVNYGFVPHFPPTKHWVISEPTSAIKNILKANGL